MWTDVTPFEPGWYWYEDEGYGPAPVLVGWTGFVDYPSARSLDIVECVGEDQEMCGRAVHSLEGHWHPLAMPKERNDNVD